MNRKKVSHFEQQQQQRLKILAKDLIVVALGHVVAVVVQTEIVAVLVLHLQKRVNC